MLALVARALIAYLLGSLVGSLVLGRLKGVDIRTQGSGNAGATNALRTQGKAFALAVLLIDFGKGLIAAGLIAWLPLPGLHNNPTLSLGWGAAACGAAAVLGHVYPVFFRFRGGKGMATYVGALAALSPLALLAGLAVWAGTLALSGYVSLATVVSVWAVALFALGSDGARSPVFAFALALALFILYTHRSNLRRLRHGTENRFERARLLHWRR